MTDTIVKEEKPIKNKLSYRKIGLFFTMLALFIFVVGFGYGYFQLLHVNTTLAQMVTSLNDKTTTVSNSLTNMQSSIKDLQQSSEQSNETQQQQQQLLSEWKAAQNGDLNKWHIAEAQYFVKLANDQLQYNNNTKVAIILLQRADQELGNAKEVDVSNLRQAIAQNITDLKALPEVDITDLYQKLHKIGEQIPQLPLIVDTVKNIEQPQKDEHLSWWRTGLNRVWEALKRIVVVQNIGENSTLAVTAEEKNYLYKGLDAQLDNAKWAVLHQNNAVYQYSLEQMQNWIKKYFAQESEVTKSVLQQVDDLAKLDVQPKSLDLSETIKLFDNQPVTTTTQATPQGQ